MLPYGFILLHSFTRAQSKTAGLGGDYEAPSSWWLLPKVFAFSIESFPCLVRICPIRSSIFLRKLRGDLTHGATYLASSASMSQGEEDAQGQMPRYGLRDVHDKSIVLLSPAMGSTPGLQLVLCASNLPFRGLNYVQLFDPSACHPSGYTPFLWHNPLTQPGASGVLETP